MSFAPVDLRSAGVHRYAEHPATDVILVRYRFGNHGRVSAWQMGDADPYDLLDHVRKGGVFVAHNATFERTMWNKVLRRNHPDWPELTIEQQDCTMSRCSALAIPAGLDFAAQVLGVTYRKDKEGQALMMRMCRPRSRTPCPDCLGTKTMRRNDGYGAFETACRTCNGVGEVYTWWDDADRMKRLGDYCEQDVLVETAIDEKVPPLSERERRVWELDQRINDRGVMLDVPMIKRLIATVEYAKTQLDKRMNEITHGFVKKCSQPAKIAEWITLMGVPCTSVAKGEQDDLLLVADALLSADIREVIELRQQASKSSTAKLKAMLNCVCADGRARGQLFYHGAHTGRWAGRLIQPQNLYRVDEEADGQDITRLMNMATAVPEPKALHGLIDMTFGKPMTMIAKTMRSQFIAAPGKKFVGADKSNIEGRINAWLAGEDWKLDAFRAYDRGDGPDLYRVAYARSFGVAVDDVRGAKRQVGKVQELALGYQGSVGAFISMGKNYRVRPADLTPIVMQATQAVVWDTMAAQFDKSKNKYGLPEDQWTALRLIVGAWRTAHPNIVQGWWDLQDAAVEAVDNPQTIVDVFGGRVRYLFARGFLWCSLPSKRLLSYCNPRVVTTKEKVTNAQGEEYERIKRSVHYDGYDGEKRQWSSHSLYGGMQCAHVVSGLARDTIVDDAFEAERRGYATVLTVHDELLTEVDASFGSDKELEQILCIVPPYCAGLPLAAKAWTDSRYSK